MIRCNLVIATREVKFAIVWVGTIELTANPVQKG